MASCPKCNGEMPTMGIVCPHCGYDFPAPRRRRGFAYSDNAEFVLVVQIWIVQIGIAATVIAMLVCLLMGAWVLALIALPFTLIGQVSSLVVLLRVKDLPTQEVVDRT